MDNSKELRNVISILERIVSNLAHTEGKRQVGKEELPTRLVYTRPGDGKRFVLRFNEDKRVYHGKNGNEEIMIKIGLVYLAKKVKNKKGEDTKVELKDDKGNLVYDLDKNGQKQPTGLDIKISGNHGMKKGVLEKEFGKKFTQATVDKDGNPKYVEVRLGHTYSIPSVRGDADIVGNLQSGTMAMKAIHGTSGYYEQFTKNGARDKGEFDSLLFKYGTAQATGDTNGASALMQQIQGLMLKQAGMVIRNWKIIPDGLQSYSNENDAAVYNLILHLGGGKASKTSKIMTSAITDAMLKSKWSPSASNMTILLTESVEGQSGRDDAYMGILSVETDDEEYVKNNKVDPTKMRVSVYTKENHDILYWNKEGRFYDNKNGVRFFANNGLEGPLMLEHPAIDAKDPMLKFEAGVSDHFLKKTKGDQEKHEEKYRKDLEDGKIKAIDYKIPDFALANELDKLFKDGRIPKINNDGSCSDELVGTTLLFKDGTIVSFEAGVEPAKMMMRRRVSSKPQKSTHANLRSMFRRMSW